MRRPPAAAIFFRQIFFHKGDYMFKVGNIVKRTGMNEHFIVLEIIPKHIRMSGKRDPFKMIMRARCIHSGSIQSPPHNTPGQKPNPFPRRRASNGEEDTWFFKNEDGSDKFHMWELISEV